MIIEYYQFEKLNNNLAHKLWLLNLNLHGKTNIWNCHKPL